jgi:hypothetical protein
MNNKYIVVGEVQYKTCMYYGICTECNECEDMFELCLKCSDEDKTCDYCPATSGF